MHAIEKSEKEKAVKYLTAAYLEDPKCQAEMEGVENKTELLANRALSYVEGLLEKGEIWIPEDERGIMVAFHTKKMSFLHYLKLIRDAENALTRAAGKDNVKKMIANSKKMKKLDDVAWYSKIGGGEAGYHVLALYVEPKSRKNGVGREMLEPLAEYCDRNDFDMSIDTSDPQSVEALKRMGFEIHRVLEDKKSPDLKVWCMVRKPGEYEEDEEV